MLTVTSPSNNSKVVDGIRPVNIETDLAPLADLIELAFHETMDESGRAAIREMRYLSKLGFGLNLLSHINDLVLGMSQGFVAIADHKLVGNVSLYPANWHKEVGKAWLIANVSTHPDYRQRGIARDLMSKCMAFIQQKGATDAILQVDYDNHHAIHLYESLGFHKERAFTRWTRSALISAPMPKDDLRDIFFAKPRRGDWEQEFDLVATTRTNEQGGIGWLRPLVMNDFRPSILRSITQALSFTDKDRFIVRSEDRSHLLSALWVERSLSRTTMTIFKHPDTAMRYTEALLSNVVRRYRSTSFTIEHPHDDVAITELLDNYRFRPRRTVWHMRYSY